MATSIEAQSKTHIDTDKFNAKHYSVAKTKIQYMCLIGINLHIKTELAYNIIQSTFEGCLSHP